RIWCAEWIQQSSTTTAWRVDVHERTAGDLQHLPVRLATRIGNVGVTIGAGIALRPLRAFGTLNPLRALRPFRALGTLRAIRTGRPRIALRALWPGRALVGAEERSPIEDLRDRAAGGGHLSERHAAGREADLVGRHHAEQGALDVAHVVIGHRDRARGDHLVEP